MSLADIKDPAFATFFNSNGGLPDQAETLAGCCVFSLTDGYLQIVDTFVSAYSVDGVRQCSATVPGPIVLGGASQPGTRYSNQFFGSTLNSTLLDQAVAVPSFTSLFGCAFETRSWGLFKEAPSPPSPPSPPPPPGPGACVAPADRVDCGFTLTESECLAVGCCWDETYVNASIPALIPWP
jgi:hypothetical protein